MVFMHAFAGLATGFARGRFTPLCRQYLGIMLDVEPRFSAV